MLKCLIGGHTSEALALVSTLDFTRYTPRKYIISEGDALSANKFRNLESECVQLKNVKISASYSVPVNLLMLLKLTGNSTSYEVVVVPRARRVHQPLITTPPTAMRSLISVLKYMIHFPSVSNAPFADVLLLNGPGTCFVLCAAVKRVICYCWLAFDANKVYNIIQFLGLPAPRVIYVESFARVNSLSLSGKLLRPLVDRFVVQWPQLLRDGVRGDCRGWLV
ncbi:oligosaccharide biosynthesis protein Alg14 like protein [Fomitiporia mediterranea MF3/22]|uniref:oligosaccharide biosynthesis protein Alg14 like protein n=1 Tax=Fomitiporia mediterranea (strain MF3/22) TaxID=694068 RepID=UPI00044093DF|nr:oligosaccharide biosynthesis protein Alg14 like protein [Fomitiporia mediterranea MF3/22]EJD02706.1 oligosaccharide biosynthesis protein Alg14 like protein [Fomitiporia mediterranea MF3/22]